MDIIIVQHGPLPKWTVNDDEAVRQRLKPFVDEVRGEDKILFWPDLESAHYTLPTRALFEEVQIPYVPREANPPNVPKLRQVEDFWGILNAWSTREAGKPKLSTSSSSG